MRARHGSEACAPRTARERRLRLPAAPRQRTCSFAPGARLCPRPGRAPASRSHGADAHGSHSTGRLSLTPLCQCARAMAAATARRRARGRTARGGPRASSPRVEPQTRAPPPRRGLSDGHAVDRTRAKAHAQLRAVRARARGRHFDVSRASRLEDRWKGASFVALLLALRSRAPAAHCQEMCLIYAAVWLLLRVVMLRLPASSANSMVAALHDSCTASQIACSSSGKRLHFSPLVPKSGIGKFACTM